MSETLSAERIKAQAEFHLEWHLPKYGHAGDPCVACLGMTPCATEQLAVGALQQAATIEALQAEVTELRVPKGEPSPTLVDWARRHPEQMWREYQEQENEATRLQAEVTTLRAALEDVQAIHDEYDGKPDFIPVAGWSAIRERLQHADVREALHGRE